LEQLPVGTRLLIGFDVPVVAVPLEPAAPDDEPGGVQGDELPFEDVAPSAGFSSQTAEPAAPGVLSPLTEDPLVTTLNTLRRRGFGLLISGRTTIDRRPRTWRRSVVSRRFRSSSIGCASRAPSIAADRFD
jgi:hypothetical protein